LGRRKGAGCQGKEGKKASIGERNQVWEGKNIELDST